MNHKLTGGEHSVLFFNQFIDVVILHPNVFLGGSSVCLNCQPLFISQSDSRGFAYLSFFTSLSNEKLLIFNILQDDFFSFHYFRGEVFKIFDLYFRYPLRVPN